PSPRSLPRGRGLRRPPPDDLRPEPCSHIPPLLRRVPCDPTGEQGADPCQACPLQSGPERSPRHLRLAWHLGARAHGTRRYAPTLAEGHGWVTRWHDNVVTTSPLRTSNPRERVLITVHRSPITDHQKD